jgi:hypothetical protein
MALPYYFWRQYETSISSSATKTVRCVGCSYVFKYEIVRKAYGRGDSPFYLSNATAAANAEKRARANLSRALSEGIEPIPCPACGIFQPNMVRLLRERYGKRYDPNKYASERIALPNGWKALIAAQKENTVEAYTKFMETWPNNVLRRMAKERIRELRYPPYLRWLLSNWAWLVWGGVVLLIIGIITVGQTIYHHNY